MAIYNEILSARFSRMLQKIFSMKGPAAMRQLSGELMPVFNFFNGVENRFLEGWDRYGSVLSLTGAAAQFVGMRIRNPGTSGTVMVVESVFAAVASQQIVGVDVSAQATDLSTGMASQRLDARSRPNSSMIMSNQTTLVATIPSSVMVMVLPANQSIQLIQNENQELTVLPGDAFSIGNSTAASLFTVGLFWRERPLEESEKKN